MTFASLLYETSMKQSLHKVEHICTVGPSLLQGHEFLVTILQKLKVNSFHEYIKSVGETAHQLGAWSRAQ